MSMNSRPFRILAPALAAFSLAACAGTYTGPVEVTRFVAENPAGLGAGTIAVAIASDERGAGELVENIYRDAIVAELEALGYTVSAETASDQQAFANLSGYRLEGRGGNSAMGVSMGGRTGSYGSGLGLGLGISLGGGDKPRDGTMLEVRITSSTSGETLWEGRAELVTSEDSQFSAPQANARALAAALFRGFPGNNGETISVDVEDLEGAQ